MKVVWRAAAGAIALAATCAVVALAAASGLLPGHGHAPARHAAARAGGRGAPIGLRGPRRLTIAQRHARFTWEAAPHSGTVGFRCRLDRRRSHRCHSGVRYGPLSLGRHSFTVVALDRHGGRSSPAAGNAGSHAPSWTWAIEPAQPLHVSGDVRAALYPGARPQPIQLSLRDPHRFSLTVRRLTVAVRGVSAPNATPSLPCGAADFRVRGYSGRGFTTPPRSHTLAQDHVPRRRWPTITMLDLPRNQDGCKGAVVHLVYRGLAARARDARPATRSH